MLTQIEVKLNRQENVSGLKKSVLCTLKYYFPEIIILTPYIIQPQSVLCTEADYELTREELELAERRAREELSKLFPDLPSMFPQT
jgi:hypothetical protein